MSNKEALDRLVWVVTDDFKKDTGDFTFKATDFSELKELFGINFKELLEARAKELGSDVTVTIEHDAPNVFVSWKPLKV